MESYTLHEGLAGSELNKYNGFNQLVETELDGMVITYAYLPSGGRTSKTVNGTKTDYILDGDKVVLELTASVATAKYVRAINLVCSTIGGTTSYYLYNGHGNVVQLTDATGAVTRLTTMMHSA